MNHNLSDEDDRKQLITNLAGDSRHFQPLPLEKLKDDGDNKPKQNNQEIDQAKEVKEFIIDSKTAKYTMDYLPGFEEIGKEMDRLMECHKILKDCAGFLEYIKPTFIYISEMTYLDICKKAQSKTCYGLDKSKEMVSITLCSYMKRYFNSLDGSEVIITKIFSPIVVHYIDPNNKLEMILPYFISIALLELSSFDVINNLITMKNETGCY